MVLGKASLAGLMSASLCLANISGTVTDSGGVNPIAGVVVQLEKGGQTATTGANGAFTLVVAGVGTLPEKPIQLANGMSARLSGGTLHVTLVERTAIEVSLFDFEGKTRRTFHKNLAAGNHSISVPQASTGNYLVKVKSGKNEIVLQENAGSGTAPGNGESSHNPAMNSLAKQTQAGAAYSDVISATKAGLLNYRCVVGNPVTTGMVIKMLASAGTVSDVEGNVYQSVKIGTQIWTAENWRCTKYNDGTAIPLDTSAATWNFAKTPKYCFYGNTTNSEQIKKYGALYNWHVISPTNAKKLAPTGWHVATKTEWETLQNYLITNGFNWDGTTTTNKVAKSVASKTDWRTNTITGTVGADLTKNNSTGFTGLPGGFRTSDGFFNYMSTFGDWWSASDDFFLTDAYYFYLNCDDITFRRDYSNKSNGLTVRLVKDL